MFLVDLYRYSSIQGALSLSYPFSFRWANTRWEQKEVGAISRLDGRLQKPFYIRRPFTQCLDDDDDQVKIGWGGIVCALPLYPFFFPL